MSKPTHVLIIKVPLTCLDDPEARLAAQGLLQATGILTWVNTNPGVQFRLQRLQQDGPPPGACFYPVSGHRFTHEEEALASPSWVQRALALH